MHPSIGKGMPVTVGLKQAGACQPSGWWLHIPKNAWLFLPCYPSLCTPKLLPTSRCICQALQPSTAFLSTHTLVQLCFGFVPAIVLASTLLPAAAPTPVLSLLLCAQHKPSPAWATPLCFTGAHVPGVHNLSTASVAAHSSPVLHYMTDLPTSKLCLSTQPTGTIGSLHHSFSHHLLLQGTTKCLHPLHTYDLLLRCTKAAFVCIDPPNQLCSCAICQTLYSYKRPLAQSNELLAKPTEQQQTSSCLLGQLLQLSVTALHPCCTTARLLGVTDSSKQAQDLLAPSLLHAVVAASTRTCSRQQKAHTHSAHRHEQQHHVHAKHKIPCRWLAPLLCMERQAACRS